MSLMLPDAVVHTLWTGGNLANVLTDSTKRDLVRARPQGVAIHAGPERLLAAAPKVAAAVRALLPDVRLWLGIGMDYWTGMAMAGRLAEARKHIADAVDMAVVLGCETVDFDPELETNEQIEAEVAREVLADARSRHPQLFLAHTAFDHPGLHGDAIADDPRTTRLRGYPWKTWVGPGGVDLELPQVYPALEHAVGRGVLQQRLASSRASYAIAVKHGWVRPELIGRGIYLQLHGVPSVDTIQVGARFPVCVGWVSELIDDEGRTALCALSELKRRGFTSVAAFQKSVGLVEDDLAGPKTLHALGL